VVIRFGEFVLDDEARQLTRDGHAIALSPKAFQLLQVLIEARPRVVSKNAVIDHLWPDVTVEEANVRNLIVEIRQALGEHGRTSGRIRTAYRCGYAFTGVATDAAAQSSRAVLQDVDRVYPLVDGVNVVGRDPGCSIHLIASGISHRHAKITLTDGNGVIKDLGSKNGTWVNDEQIVESYELRDGDVIRLGRSKLMFRSRPAIDSTTTIGR
jgi:DNA-binding winged helix-turn-helix (wHTH) protein